MTKRFITGFLVAASLGVGTACAAAPEGEAPPPAPSSVVPADPAGEAAFARAMATGSTPRLIEIDSVVSLAPYQLGGPDGNITLASGIEIRGRERAPRAGRAVAYRAPTGDLCGSVAGPGGTACVTLNFQFEHPPQPGDVWIVADAPQGEPNAGFWSILGGWQTDPSADATTLARAVSPP